jgi:hypothetical protein
MAAHSRPGGELSAMRVEFIDWPGLFVAPPLTAVATDVMAIVRQSFGGPPPLGAKPGLCRRAPDGLPRAINVPADSACYEINLTVEGLHYCQLAYQFAHELGHIWLDHRRGNWVVETIAAALSLHTLDKMAERWSEAPPYENWRSYAPNFVAYRRDTEAEQIARLPEHVPLSAEAERWQDVTSFLGGQRSRQERDPLIRELHHLGAIALRAQGIRWPSLVGVAGLTEPPVDEDPSFIEDAAFDRGRLPQVALRMVEVIGF